MLARRSAHAAGAARARRGSGSADIGGARWAGDHVDGARQRVDAVFFAHALPHRLVIARDVVGVDHHDVRVGQEVERGRIVRPDAITSVPVSATPPTRRQRNELRGRPRRRSRRRVCAACATQGGQGGSSPRRICIGRLCARRKSATAPHAGSLGKCATVPFAASTIWANSFVRSCGGS